MHPEQLSSKALEVFEDGGISRLGRTNSGSQPFVQ
jgi:hypothetical protein